MEYGSQLLVLRQEKWRTAMDRIRDRTLLIEQMEYKEGAKKKNVVHITFSRGCLFTEMNSQYMATSS
jgi:hypothetical protein